LFQGGSSQVGISDDRPWVGRVVARQLGMTPPLRIGLLGGFRVERAGLRGPVAGWQRRSAKTLTKLLATYPRHALHREQVVEILWPGVDLASGLNSFGKAVHAARRAFEPGLPPRQSSAYLCLTDSMLALNSDCVTVDADCFQQLAESALASGEIESYESALAAYGGELLPEDRYEDWCAERRDFLAGLQIRLLMGLADALEKSGSLSASMDRLHQVLQHDPTREDVHRRLMALYAETGSRDQAVRQFQLCEDALRRELGLAP
jgi:DNA-binding SARP family transcriptional activator